MRAFISYSHKDALLLAELHAHLAALRRQELVITWTDREISAGGIIDREIDEHLDESELYLLLISPAFIDSRYCYEREFSRALERQRAGKAIIVPIILRDCDWNLPELRQFKALPEDGRAVTGRTWHNTDEAFTNVSTGLRQLIESAPFSSPKAKVTSRKKKFIPDASHVTEAQRARLREIAAEVSDRLTAKSAALPDHERKKKVGRAFGILWSQFNAEFGTTEHGLANLPQTKFDDAKSWLLQYRASKDKNFKRTNPQKYRNALTRTIFALAKQLGWSDENVHAFAAEKLRLERLESFKELGNNQLELVRDRVRYEHTKRAARAGQARAKKRASPLARPTHKSGREILAHIITNPNRDQWGLTEIKQGHPESALLAAFMPSIASSGSAFGMKKSDFRPAMSELVKLGWLLLPEEDDKVKVYEATPQAKLEV